ncbi:MAG: Asp-tRNA(Asn)/Glu-tRNA(Gln) amidotransferase subunit GatA [Candidatus Altiarchaeota archaeon]|nr:Asp-tRNA(Asn)/Glu-tRNA(Gln) amidotransferase subunit GatA [Candidatus Altiarchaeota archaeon]MBU4406353.1 Asp-tRNA(Asn)/Glu-tRNA(Gln) amidotransferase subunit GatA [Candidatus Altiarchaeota archaeon]MBU4437730.1 Asp-tRNA(Asn)/Glu-tRNA(Gln) amidotransferase subunit GatA [Candidatus Altiarchaeota archaeon]
MINMQIQERLDDIERGDKDINSFIVLDKEGLSRKDVKTGGRLDGLAIGIKSNICVQGLLTSGGSKTLENYIAPYNATVVKRIKESSGLILGMCNMDEFACGGSGETSYYGATKNPAALENIPGGSSSGSAAAVAAGFVDVAIGSDTGGSIRNPASHCGVVGFKPTYGVVSRYGLIDLAMSLDQIGPIAKDVKKAVLLLDVIAGHDPRDETSLQLDKKFYNFSKNLNKNLKGIKIGYAGEFDNLISDKGIKNLIHKSLDKLTSAGAEIVDVSLPNLEIALPTYYLNMYVEFFSATRKYDGRRYGHRIEEVCGEEVLRRILLGSYISQKEYSGRYYRKALQARSVIRKELESALGKVDVLAGPVVPKLPHKLGTKIDDPMVMYAYDIFTVIANLAGIPAGSVPAGKVGGIPTGLQVIGNALDDQKVLDVMYAFEQNGS